MLLGEAEWTLLEAVSSAEEKMTVERVPGLAYLHKDTENWFELAPQLMRDLDQLRSHVAT